MKKTICITPAQDRVSVFRKKPVVAQASQWFKPGDHDAVTPWTMNPGGRCRHCKYDYRAHGRCATLEGGGMVCPGDWIITGVKGEPYPCKPDIFAETYEPADDARTARADWNRRAPDPRLVALSEEAAERLALELAWWEGYERGTRNDAHLWRAKRLLGIAYWNDDTAPAPEARAQEGGAVGFDAVLVPHKMLAAIDEVFGMAMGSTQRDDRYASKVYGQFREAIGLKGSEHMTKAPLFTRPTVSDGAEPSVPVSALREAIAGWRAQNPYQHEREHLADIIERLIAKAGGGVT